MADFSEKIKNAPKGLLIMGGITLLVLLLFGIYKFAIEDMIKPKAAETEKPQIVIDFPDANEDGKDLSKLDEIRHLENTKSRSRASDYWNSLGPDGDDGGLVSSNTDSGNRGENYYNGQYLDPNIYSDIERYYIKNGTWTIEEVDAKHAEEARKRAEQNSNRGQELTQEQRDSIYFARMEKAYGLAQKYTSQPDAAVPAPAPAEVKEPEEELKHIEVEKKSLPSTTLRQEDIISSLEATTPGTIGETLDEENLIPAKATFLKTESLVSGQRVVMRLMQDLQLSDGTIIPANTHIKGICDVSNRLKISVTTINYGGKIYYTNLDIYDNDGTEGIYCPVIVAGRKDKSGQRLGKTALSEAASIASSALSANPYLGRMAGQSIREITQSIDVNGNISVSVTSGYEFYVFENLEKNEKKNRRN